MPPAEWLAAAALIAVRASGMASRPSLGGRKQDARRAETGQRVLSLVRGSEGGREGVGVAG